MLKVGNCVRSRLTAYIKKLTTVTHINHLCWLIPQRCFIQSCPSLKTYSIKDHYEFDQKVINSNVPVIVNFHAEWCEPCKVFTPKLAQLLENSDEIDLATIDVDVNTELVETFEVKAVPAVLAFRNGVVVDKFIGLPDSKSVKTLIDKLKEKGPLQK